jgi:hypothetical protein
MIMSLTSRESGVPLFHNVDLDWRGDGYTFQYSPSVKAEAECAISTLYPLAQHYFPNADLEDSFTTETAERCAPLKYDPETGNIIDETLGDQLTAIDDDQLLGFTFDMEDISTNNKDNNQDESRPPEPTYDRFFPTDNDSVSTFGKPTTPSRSDNPIITAHPRVRRLNTASHDNSSVTSITSGVTVETLESMNSQILFLTKQGSSINQKFDLIMEKLGIEMRGNGTSPGEKAGAPPTGSSKAGSEGNPPPGGVP